MQAAAFEDVLGVSEVAALLRCSERTVEDKARAGDLPGLKFGDGGWVFPRPALITRLTEEALAEASKRRAPPTSVKAMERKGSVDLSGPTIRRKAP